MNRLFVKPSTCSVVCVIFDVIFQFYLYVHFSFGFHALPELLAVKCNFILSSHSVHTILIVGCLTSLSDVMASYLLLVWFWIVGFQQMLVTAVNVSVRNEF